MAKQLFSKDLKITPGAAAAPPPRPSGGRQNRHSREMPVKNAGVRMNGQIRVASIRVIDEEGVVGVMSPEEAMKIAKERGVDLIEIAPNAEPPVCKLMDFGKWRYEQQKRDRQAKATQHKQLMKELRFHPGTDTHDFDFKLRHARTWLEEGHKVKATVQFKGREIAYKEFGEKLLRKLEEALTDISKVDQPISTTGKLMTMVFGPQGKGPKKPAKGDGESDAPKEAKPSEFAELLVKKISSSDLAVPVPEASGSDSEDAL